MRKQNIGYLFDKIFWYTLYMLPLIIYIIFTFKNLTQPHISIANDYFGFDYYTLEHCVEMVADQISFNFIYRAFIPIFGYSSSILPFGSYTGVIAYLSYLIMLNIIHLFVDILLFIPRWCHKMLRKGEEYAED